MARRNNRYFEFEARIFHPPTPHLDVDFMYRVTRRRISTKTLRDGINIEMGGRGGTRSETVLIVFLFSRLFLPGMDRIN